MKGTPERKPVKGTPARKPVKGGNQETQKRELAFGLYIDCRAGLALGGTSARVDHWNGFGALLLRRERKVRYGLPRTGNGLPGVPEMVGL